MLRWRTFGAWLPFCLHRSVSRRLPEEGLGPPRTASTCCLAFYSCTCPCQPAHLSKGDANPHRASWLLRQICSTMEHGELYHMPGAHHSCSKSSTPTPRWSRAGELLCPTLRGCFPGFCFGIIKKLTFRDTSVFKDIVEDIVQCITRVLQMRIHRENFSLWPQHIPVLLLRSCFCLINYLLLLLHIVMINSCSSSWPHFRITRAQHKDAHPDNKSGPLGQSLGVFLSSSPESLMQSGLRVADT